MVSGGFARSLTPEIYVLTSMPSLSSRTRKYIAYGISLTADVKTSVLIYLLSFSNFRLPAGIDWESNNILVRYYSCPRAHVDPSPYSPRLRLPAHIFRASNNAYQFSLFQLPRSEETDRPRTTPYLLDFWSE